MTKSRNAISVVVFLLTVSIASMFSLSLIASARASSGQPALAAAMTDAIITNNSDAAQLLLRQGLSANRSGYRRTTFLMMASGTGNTQIVTMLLKAGAKVNTKDIGGDTALSDAVTIGHLDVVELLIKRGANVNNQDENGSTPLMLVSYEGEIELMKALLRAKASRRTVDRGNFTALMWAVKGNHPAAIRLLQSST